MSKKIPVYGSMKRPADVEEGLLELKEGLLEWNKGDILVEYETEEFTSVCPTTGQPDFMKMFITYMPDQKYIESKNMKFYMWSFREHGVHCEHLADMIAKDIMSVTECKYIKVVAEQKPRGGLKLTSTKELGKDESISNI